MRKSFAPPHGELFSVNVERLPKAVTTVPTYTHHSSWPRVWGKELTFGGTNGTFGLPRRRMDSVMIGG